MGDLRMLMFVQLIQKAAAQNPEQTGRQLVGMGSELLNLDKWE